MCQQLLASLDPKTDLERELAQTVVDQQWRLNRIRAVEDGMLSLPHFERAANFDTDSPDSHATLAAAQAFCPHSNTFVKLSISEQRIHRPSSAKP